MMAVRISQEIFTYTQVYILHLSDLLNRIANPHRRTLRPTTLSDK